MNVPVNEKKQVVLQKFDECHRRLSARKRWNFLFSGLIAVLSFWILFVLLEQFRLLPSGESVSRLILGLGVLGTLLGTWKQQVDPSHAAYVFDRLNQFEGAFLTWFSEREQLETDTLTYVHTVLLLHIHGILRKESILPERSFPTGKAVASTGLLLIGFFAGHTIHVPVRSDVPGPNKSARNETRQTKEKASESSQNQDPGSKKRISSSSRRKAKQMIQQLDQLKQDVKKAKNQGSIPENLEDRRNRLERKTKSFLQNQNHSASGQSQSTESSGDSSFDSSDNTDKRAGKQRTSGGQERTLTETGSENTGKTQNLDRSEVTIEDLERALRRLEKNELPEGKKREMNTADAENSGGSRTSSTVKIPEEKEVTGSEAQLFEIDSQELETALNRSDRVRDWGPKYDRSIEKYRSFLRSYVNRRGNDETNN